MCRKKIKLAFQVYKSIKSIAQVKHIEVHTVTSTSLVLTALLTVATTRGQLRCPPVRERTLDWGAAVPWGTPQGGSEREPTADPNHHVDESHRPNTERKKPDSRRVHSTYIRFHLCEVQDQLNPICDGRSQNSGCQGGRGLAGEPPKGPSWGVGTLPCLDLGAVLCTSVT